MRSIRTKLILAFTTVILLMVIISSLLINNGVKVQHQYQTLSNNILLETEIDYATSSMIEALKLIVKEISHDEIRTIEKESMDLDVIINHLDNNIKSEKSRIIYMQLKAQVSDFQETCKNAAWSFSTGNYVNAHRHKELAFIQHSILSKKLDDLLFAEIDFLYQTQKELTQQSNQSFVSGAILLGFSTIFSFVFVLMFSNSLRNKIGILLDVTKEIADGNYNLEPIRTTYKDEIGELMYSVEIMRQKQKKSTDELRNWNFELEDRVQKRTLELKESNIELSVQKESLIELNKQLQNSLERIKRTQSQLIESEKMASLNYLVTGIAHEINTPLGTGITEITYGIQIIDRIHTAIKSNKLKKKQLADSVQEINDIFNSLLRCQNKTKELVEKFKEISVMNQKANIEEFSIEDMYESVLMNLRHKMDMNTIAIDFECDRVRILTDQGKLSVILTNLITNSLEHGFEDADEGKIKICISQREGFLKLNYKDDGAGADAETLKHMFDPFFSTKISGIKSGLGLLIIYNIVKQYFKGDIQYQSTLGRGLSYDITIPLHDINLKTECN